MTTGAPPLDPALIDENDGGEPALRAWRCRSCGRLSLGARDLCPLCGSRDGGETRLAGTARLQTWTHVAGEQDYVIGYGLAGDGDDDQQVRLFGPIEVDDENELRFDQALEIRFRSGLTAKGNERLHHYFVPGA